MTIVIEHLQDDAFYDQLEQAMAEAANARRDVYQETVRRVKAEKDAIDVMRKVTLILLSCYYFCNV